MAVTVKIERETYEKNGKTFFTYFIKGVLRGKEVKATLAPPDVGGYTVLDIVFDNAMEADLSINPFEMKDSSGNVINGKTFIVKSVDENGEVYECKVKPLRQSDKDLLAMLFK